MLSLIGAVIVFVAGFLVGRNNPSLAAVNTLIAKGKAVISKAGNIVKTIK